MIKCEVALLQGECKLRLLEKNIMPSIYKTTSALGDKTLKLSAQICYNPGFKRRI